MPSALDQFRNQSKLAPTVSRWPGAAVRIPSGLKAGQIEFRRGVIIKVTDLYIFIEAEPRAGLEPLVKLMSDSYIHHCRWCQRTIPGNVTYNRSMETRLFCPFCGPGHPLANVKEGTKVLLHFRFEKDSGAWGSWFAEVREW